MTSPRSIVTIWTDADGVRHTVKSPPGTSLEQHLKMVKAVVAEFAYWNGEMLTVYADEEEK